MTQPTAMDRVASHIANTRYPDLPALAVERTKTFLLDSLGVGIAGTSGSGIDTLKLVASGWGKGEDARVWLTGERMPAQSAAIINAYQIHCLEFDCVHEGAVLHPMATILSAVFAWAERARAHGKTINGRELIAALAIGVDVSTMLGAVTNAPLRFFRPATAGGFGAAAAIASLSGFGENAIKDALGGQYAQTSGTLQPHVEGSPMLGMQVGFNARAAIVATDLAAAGIRGPHDILTGQYGYLVLFEQNDYDLEPFLAGLGKEWQVTALSHKPFPSGRLTHGAIDGLARLQQRHGIDPRDIEKVTVKVPPLNFRLVGRPDIPDPEANYAKLCLRFVAGVYLAKGRVDVPDFRGDALRDPEVHRYAGLVEVVQDDNPDLNALDPQRVEVRLRDGTRYEIDLPRIFGHPESPLSRDQNVEKFRRCCGYGLRPLPQQQIDALLGAIEGLEAETDITRLIDLMMVPQ
jgi:2-methylcitrate dehydratase PrpD